MEKIDYEVSLKCCMEKFKVEMKDIVSEYRIDANLQLWFRNRYNNCGDKQRR